MADSDKTAADTKVAVFRAQQLLEEKRYADALQVCTDELARGRDDPDLRLVAARSLLAQGRHEGAKKEAQLVIRLDPREPEAYRILADVAASRGELDAARDHLERVLDLEPDDAEAQAQLRSLSGGGRGLSTGASGVLGGGAGGDQDLDFDHKPVSTDASVVLDADDLLEEEEDSNSSVVDNLFPPVGATADEESGEALDVTDSMMEDLPSQAGSMLPGGAPAAGRGGDPGEAWRPGVQDAGSGKSGSFKSTLRLPSLDEPPEEDDAPTMPLLRPTAPPAPQLKLDPMASKPVSHDKAPRQQRPSGPQTPPRPQRPSGPQIPPPHAPPPRGRPVSGAQQPARRRPGTDSMPRLPAQSRSPSGPVAPTSRPPASGPGSQARRQPPPPSGQVQALQSGEFDDFGLEPASIPMRRPDPKPIPRSGADPRQSQPGAAPAGGAPAAPADDADPLAMLTGGVGHETGTQQALADNASGGQPIAQSPSDPGGMMGLLAGDQASRASDSFPSVSADSFPAVDGAPETTDELEAQLAAAGLSEKRPRRKRKGGKLYLWLFLLLLLAGGGGYGYWWYRSYKYVQGELATLRTQVHLSTPDGFRKARETAKRILEHKGSSPKATAAIAMCDAAMSIEFGEDRLKSAKEKLAATKGTDSEWRTAATAFLALMDDPERAAGYLEKGLEVYPGSAILHYVKGRAQAASGKRERAAESFQAALKHAPELVAAKVALAVLVGQNKDRLTEAVGMLDEVVSRSPGNVQALIERARLRARHGKELDQAAADARRVTNDLVEKAGKGQVGWAHLVLAQVAHLKGESTTASAELDQAAQTPPCCDSSFAYELAGQMMDLYRMVDAHGQMERALELKPKQPEYLQRMARVLLELGDTDGAKSQLDLAPARLLETRLLQGRLFYAQRHYAKAVDQLQRVLNEDPKQVEAQTVLALARARRGKTDAALALLRKLRKDAPTDHRVANALARVHLWNDNFARCHHALKASWKLTKLDPATPSIAGKMYIAQHKLKTARKRFERALRIRPEYRPAHLGLVELSLLAGDAQGARAELGKISELEKKRYDVYAATAEVELAEGNTSAAKLSVEQAESAGAPAGLLARIGGQVALAQRDYAGAAKQFAKAIKLEGADGELLSLLGQAQRLAGMVDASYDTFHRALKQDDGKPEALLGLARIAIRDGEHGLVLKRVEDAIKQVAARGRPQSLKAEGHTVLGLAYLQKGDTGRAITNLQDAIDLDPQAAEPNMLMGQTYDKLDRPQRAVGYYAKAVKLDPGLAEAYYRLGKAYEKAGDGAAAARHYQEYLNRKPPAARAQEVGRALQRLQGQ